MSPTAAESAFARIVAARYGGPTDEHRLSDVALMRDALWLVTSHDPDEREMGLYVLSLGSPLLVADLYARVRGNDRARDDVARMVHAELHLLVRPDDAWRSFERVVRERPSLQETLPAMVKDALASRRQWADAVFARLDPADNDDLRGRLERVERNVRVGAHANRR